MSKFGLIGKSLSHSFSKNYFEKKFKDNNTFTENSYENIELETIELVQNVFDQKTYKGFNVTIPYKESIIPYLTNLSKQAKEIGAVNTVVQKGNELIGHNTDCIGFRNSIKPFLKNIHTRALILGTGGASKAVAYTLDQIGIDYLFASRNPKKSNEIAYSDINEYVIKFHLFIINTTPIGTFPNTEEAPDIPYQYLTENHFLYDLVYNPSETLFLKKGKEKGALVSNGYDMLVQQAEESWKIWRF